MFVRQEETMKENVRNRVLLSGCEGEENGYNTQLLYFTCSPLTRDDRYLFLITDKGGSPNVMVRDLLSGEEKILTRNRNGIMKNFYRNFVLMNYLFLPSKE